MRRVVLVTTSYPTSADGSEAAGGFVWSLCASLAQQLQVTVVAPSLEAKRCTVEGVDQRYFAVDRLPLSLLSPTNPAAWGSIYRVLTNGYRAVAEASAEVDAEHVICLWALPCGYWARKARESLGTPYSVWALGSDIWALGKVPVVRSVLRRVLQDSAHCYADGLELCEQVTAISGRECEFLPSCRRLTTAPLDPKAPQGLHRLAYLGRWHLNKGVDILMQALSLLRAGDWARIEQVRIAGGGPLDSQVWAAVDDLVRQGRPVQVEGYKDAAAALALFQWAHYVLIPSRIESIPVVFSDAMQCGCPVVCNPVGDLPRLVTQYGVGIVGREVSALAYAQALSEALLAGVGRYASGVGQAARDFDIEAVAARLARAVALTQGNG